MRREEIPEKADAYTYDDCFECGGEVPVAVWEGAIIGGYAHPMCDECYNTVPEALLWEVSEDTVSPPCVDVPEPPRDNADWEVRDYYRDWKDNWDLSDLKERSPPPRGEVFEIIVRDASDIDAVRAARGEVRRRRSA